MEKYEYPLIEINKYLKLQIQMQKKKLFKFLSFLIFHTII